MSDKKRLDVYLFENGMAESREEARALIMSGCVFVDGQRSDKPGNQVTPDKNVEIRGQTLEFVSRGGLKLKKALAYFNVSPEGFTCADCGASTGGFTDCLLKNGAKKVYAVDVGYGQLAWSIRSDERVVVLERTNVRYLTREQIPEELDLATIDVSFISLKLVLPAVFGLLKGRGEVLCLIKPQFEAGREKVGKKGVVREASTHVEVIKAFLKNAEEAGFSVLGVTYSPIRGPEGNIEYLGHLRKGPGETAEIDAEAIVKASHLELDGGNAHE